MEKRLQKLKTCPYALLLYVLSSNVYYPSNDSFVFVLVRKRELVEYAYVF